MGKYGEDSKLVYDLQDQGGELCSLRYDLTVPFARYVAMNRIKQMKRYHIARVYRRDNPAMNKGRFREFYQCDFDIAGHYDAMIPDAECIKLMTEVLDEVKVGKYIIKLNHRKILDGIFAVCGVPEASFRQICSAVDKLDKATWEEVRKEMVEQKGLNPEVADKIEKFVMLKGPPNLLLQRILEEKQLDSNPMAVEGLNDLKTLFKYLDIYGVTDKVIFDLSLARGLDYYTGVIYEAALTDTDKVGSIAAGGRYDNLVGIFGGENIPAVGFSVGVERIFSILEDQADKNYRGSPTMVLVASIDKDLLVERMKLCKLLWDNDIKAEFLLKEGPKIQAQLNYANSLQVPFALIFGKDEIQKGIIQIKDLRTATKENVSRDNLIVLLKQKISALTIN